VHTLSPPPAPSCRLLERAGRASEEELALGEVSLEVCTGALGPMSGRASRHKHPPPSATACPLKSRLRVPCLFPAPLPQGAGLLHKYGGAVPVDITIEMGGARRRRLPLLPSLGLLRAAAALPPGSWAAHRRRARARRMPPKAAGAC
jgi:hypothetical protein